MKKIETDLDYGMSEESKAAFGVDKSDKQITWFLIEQCFSAVFNNTQKGGMNSDNGIQYRQIRQAFEAALENGDSTVLLAASDFNFLKKTVENCKLVTGLAFIKPVLQEALSNATEEKIQ